MPMVDSASSIALAGVGQRVMSYQPKNLNLRYEIIGSGGHQRRNSWRLWAL